MIVPMTLPAGLLASSLLRWALLRVARAGGEVRCDMLNRHTLAALALIGAALTACKDPPPDPVPADCKPPNHCADQEGPPPVGSTDPPKT